MANKSNKKRQPAKDDLESYGQDRLKTQKIVAWVAIIGLLVTTGLTMGIAPLISG